MSPHVVRVTLLSKIGTGPAFRGVVVSWGDRGVNVERLLVSGIQEHFLDDIFILMSYF